MAKWFTKKNIFIVLSFVLSILQNVGVVPPAIDATEDTPAVKAPAGKQ